MKKTAGKEDVDRIRSKIVKEHERLRKQQEEEEKAKRQKREKALEEQKQKEKQRPRTLFKYLASSLALVFLLHGFHYLANGDPLASPYVNGPYVSIDSWSFIHLFYFAVLGYHFPEQMVLFMLYGVVWEVIEWLLSNHTVEFWEESQVNTLWDLWFNFMGYRIGELIRISKDKEY